MQLIHKIRFCSFAAAYSDAVRTEFFAAQCKFSSDIAKPDNKNFCIFYAFNVSFIAPKSLVLIVAIDIKFFHQHQKHSKHMFTDCKSVCTACVCKFSSRRKFTRIGIRPCHVKLQKLQPCAFRKNIDRDIADNNICGLNHFAVQFKRVFCASFIGSVQHSGEFEIAFRAGSLKCIDMFLRNRHCNINIHKNMIPFEPSHSLFSVYFTRLLRKVNMLPNNVYIYKMGL